MTSAAAAPAGTATAPLLQVRDLQAHLFLKRGVLRAVDGVSFDLVAGQTLGLVGESGSGKSMTCAAIMRLLPRGSGRIAAGSIRLHRDDGMVDLIGLDDESMRRVRGAAIGMV
ncbi:MAG: ATP-binding cassette domain-containing protein, partial [Aquabacterium sp.]